ncbi:MAG: sulfur oxidation c-type cytochrome SoxX [Candidatus Thioglobus sp.]|nr:MAG: sulfur oxidation c-type cytochrome SoxX [Candidatus Thioglobus sp.]KAA0456442.1 MAG: sulfur oxidation c-type cytochrome SoxX [Candidatus Thioglobus sp.]
MADKKSNKSLKKAAKTCKSVHPKDVSGCALTFSRSHGNCLACHQIKGGALSGNIAPPLIAMKARFPNKAVLRAQIWDATVKKPGSVMVPFGRHKVLTEKQIDKVTSFIHSL